VSIHAFAVRRWAEIGIEGGAMLLGKAYDATAAVLAEVTDWDAQSPCAEWSVREVANHLVGALKAFVAAVEHTEFTMDGDHLGDDPHGAFRAAADRCLAAFDRPGALTEEHPFPFGPTPGSVIAAISLSETVVHGWDIARGAGVAYSPAPEVVDEVLAHADEFKPPAEGMFGPPVEVAPDAPPLTRLLARTGRTA
jgi:uncharacterized protein (TIGR03086 family)